MSKKEKRIESIKNNPKNVKFQNLKKVLENLGYKAINNGGSHYVFTKENATSLTIPFRNPVKVVYVKQVISIIEDEGI